MLLMGTHGVTKGIRPAGHLVIAALGNTKKGITGLTETLFKKINP